MHHDSLYTTTLLTETTPQSISIFLFIKVIMFEVSYYNILINEKLKVFEDNHV